MHSNVIPNDYTRVEVLSVSMNHVDYEVEIPTPDSETVLDNPIGYFIAWQRRDIVQLTTPSGAPSASRQLQLRQVEEQAKTGPMGEACAQLSSTYEQQMMDPFMDVSVVQANPNLNFSYE